MSKILIVDDKEENRYLLQTILTASGHETREAANGAQALELARREHPDLIISDILMPQMDGFALCRECKRDKTLRGIPFIFYTATYTDQRDRDFGLQLGAARFVVKPMEAEEFSAVIEEMLGEDAQEKLSAPTPPVEDETTLYRLYNEALIRKLEEKMLDLERAKRTLELEIQERKQKEAELAAKERCFLAMIEKSSDAIARLNDEGTIIYCSASGAVLLGYSDNELLGHSAFELIYPDDLPRVAELFTQLTASPGKNIMVEFRYKHKNGTFLHVEASATNLLDDPDIKAIVVNYRDITERKRIEEQLHQAQKMEAVGQLAGGIAHDFNNFLTAIIGYSSVLQLKMKEDESLRSYIDAVLSAAEKAASLTQSLLSFSRKQIINPKPVNLNELIGKLGKLLVKLIREDIEFKTLLSDKTLIVMADSGQIEQALMNLSTNARDAMPDGGIFTIETREIKFDEEFIAAHGYGEPGRYAVISITDTGMGMDKNTRERIFEPFFTTKDIGKGTGLGLAMVYGLITQHNGYINVYSESGKGTTFHLYLPLIKAEDEAISGKTVSEAPPVGGKENLLVTDDNEEVRALVKILLENAGYKVLTACDGEDSINIFKQNKDLIDLVILDVIMPKKNGKEVYQEISRIMPGIKVIFMSGYTADVIHQKGIFDEGLEYIQKPISPNELLRKVRETLDR